MSKDKPKSEPAPFTPEKQQIVNEVSAAIAAVCQAVEKHRSVAASQGVFLSYTVSHESDGYLCAFRCEVREKNDVDKVL